MSEFLKAKAILMNAVWHGVFDTGAEFESCLDAIERCETATELAAIERRVRRLDSANVTARVA